VSDVNDRIRQELNRIVPTPGEGYEETVGRVRRRQRNRRAGAASLGLVLTGLLAVGIWIGLRQRDQMQPRPASNPNLPEHGMAFADGRLLRFTPDGTEVVARLPERIAPVPPVMTPSGVVVLTGRPSIDHRLWLVAPDGSVREIDHDVTAGFAVDPAEDVVAYATTEVGNTSPYYTTFIHIVRLNDGTQVSISPDLQFYAAVAGIVDGKVLLSTGDGGSASVGLWSPAGQMVRRYPAYGLAVAADPATGISVLNVGDGRVPAMVRFEKGPKDDLGMTPVEMVVDSSVLQLQGIDFAPGGGLVAGIQSTGDGAEVVVIDESSGRVTARMSLSGGSQTAWSGRDTILVLDKSGSEATVGRCDLATDDCEIGSESVASSGQFGYGVWLVSGSF
jgi:hypothetical protein